MGTMLEWILRNVSIDTAQDMESPCECGIEPPGFVSHVVRLINSSSRL